MNDPNEEDYHNDIKASLSSALTKLLQQERKSAADVIYSKKKKSNPLAQHPIYPYLSQLMRSTSIAPGKIPQLPMLSLPITEPPERLIDPSRTMANPPKKATYYLKQCNGQNAPDLASIGTVKVLHKQAYTDIMSTAYLRGSNTETNKRTFPLSRELEDKFSKLKIPIEPTLGQISLVIRKIPVLKATSTIKLTKNKKLINTSSQSIEAIKARRDLTNYMLALSSNKYKVLLV